MNVHESRPCQNRPDGGPANSRYLSGFSEDATKSTTDPRRTKFRRIAPSMSRRRGISGDRVGITLDPAPSPRNRPCGRSANSRDTADSRGAKSRQEIGDFAELLPTRWGNPRIPPHRRRTGRAAGPRSPDIFRGLVKILRSRPNVHEHRSSAVAPQVCGYFSESRPIGRGSLNRAYSPKNRPGGGSAASPDFSGFPGDSTHPLTDP